MTGEIKGFGTYNLRGKHLEVSLQSAFQNGVNLLDIAEAYENVSEICTFINMYFQETILTSPLILFYKIWLFSGESAIQRIIQFQRKALFEHFLIVSAHWPLSRDEDNFQLLDELVDLKQKGLIQGVGLSNYSYRQCRYIYQRYRNSIWGLESEMHPFYINSNRLSFCIDHGWKFIASSPLYRNRKCDPVIENIASKYNISYQQLMLLWSKQRGAIPIPCSTNSDHISLCLNLPQINLSSTEMNSISAIKPVNCNFRICHEDN